MTTVPSRIPALVYLLGIGIFCLGTSEFMIAGLLPEISVDLRTSIPAAASLVWTFALGMIVGAPLMAVSTLRLPRRTVLVGALTTFAVMHVAVVGSDSLVLISVSRIVSAFACGAFWAVGAVVAVRSSPPAAAGRALAVLAGGLTLSYVAGVPLGTFIGQQFGWRSTFVAVAVATMVVTVLVALFVPTSPGEEATSLRERIQPELGVFRQVDVWLVLAVTAVFQAALIGTFTFLAPLLTDVVGLSAGAVPVVLLVFGIGSLVGITAGGHLADRSVFGTIAGGLGGMLVTLVVLVFAGDNPVLAIGALALLGVCAYTLAPALNARVFVIAGDAPTLAAAVNTSAFNVGNFLGPVLGAVVIATGGFRAPVFASIALTLVAGGLTAVAWRTARRAQKTLAHDPQPGEVASGG